MENAGPLEVLCPAFRLGEFSQAWPCPTVTADVAASGGSGCKTAKEDGLSPAPSWCWAALRPQNRFLPISLPEVGLVVGSKDRRPLCCSLSWRGLPSNPSQDTAPFPMSSLGSILFSFVLKCQKAILSGLGTHQQNPLPKGGVVIGKNKSGSTLGLLLLLFHVNH